MPREVQQLLEENRSKANDGLSLFQRCPEGMKGEELLDHSIGFMHRQYAKKPDEFGISQYLSVSPHNNHQRALLQLDYHQQVMGSLMADLNEGVPKRQAAQCRLDNLGTTKSHSGFVNNPERLEKQRFRLTLMRSLGCADEEKAKHEACRGCKESNRRQPKEYLARGS